MKIETLKYFVVTAQSQTITESAAKLYMAQPSLTKALHNLEAELGYQLFDRSKHGIVLTEAGKQIFPQARQVVEYYQEWMLLGKQKELKELHIYVSRSFADMFLPGILVSFRQRYPDLSIHFEAVRNPDIYLSRDTSTPVITLFACETSEMLDCAKIQGSSPVILMEGSCRCLVNRESPLARSAYVTPEELKDYFLVLPGAQVANGNYLSGSRAASSIISACPPSHIITVESVSNVITAVAENPKTYANAHFPSLLRYGQVQRGELVSLPIGGYEEPVNICLFYSRQACRQYPVMAELVTAICDAFREFADRVAVEKTVRNHNHDC